MREGQMSHGYHNQNFLVELDAPMAQQVGRDTGTLVTVRARRLQTLPVVIRTWQNEWEILGAVGKVMPEVPQCLARVNGVAVHSYVEGVPLSTVSPNGRAVDRSLVKVFVKLMARMSQVPRATLPPLPSHWPDDGDSQGFLQTLAEEVDQQVCEPNWPEYGELFTALDISRSAMTRYVDRVPVMTRRPYGLLHADLHRDNVILTYSGEPPLICVDWELATYGDPLHDLAVHLVRMRYPQTQQRQVIAAWKHAFRRVSRRTVSGLDKDLRHYIDFERAQSVFPDVIRAAQSLGSLFDQENLDRATKMAGQALEAAAGPLGLGRVPNRAEIERALVRWSEERGGRHVKSRSLAVVARNAVRETRKGAALTQSQVEEALAAERTTPDYWVLKGTAHRNSVVRVAGRDDRVVVRRRMLDAPVREPGLHAEHVVLETIERAETGVSVPEVLARGGNDRDGYFAIHTYVGPATDHRPPQHPVHGLSPAEADALVEQLRALTQVDHSLLSPAAGEDDFYTWLSEQLVDLVSKLPSVSMQLAQELGLPGEDELWTILHRHRVTPRAPALLHGDLNPWNLVRREDKRSLALVDWERAMVGDPLYDLVRHMHLARTPWKARERMFRHWARILPEKHTRGWQHDRGVYRRLEVVRSAYVDLDRLVTRVSLDAPNVSVAVDSYATTLRRAKIALGLRRRPQGGAPLLLRALPYGEVGMHVLVRGLAGLLRR
ncbi:aminoglycoside phosphotransferase family protein [Streptomyces phyllanthi]|uniref:Aminoglycoside phosphotransferase family protein n=2 Tax=Streptomyces phyllanthi TaxID=1803180 RepID=A0A5N8VZN6_9ACTN|nr:aminoglycoside phosphotransferase family protein [Streptomyces phyllanthi]